MAVSDGACLKLCGVAVQWPVAVGSPGVDLPGVVAAGRPKTARPGRRYPLLFTTMSVPRGCSGLEAPQGSRDFENQIGQRQGGQGKGWSFRDTPNRGCWSIQSGDERARFGGGGSSGDISNPVITSYKGGPFDGCLHCSGDMDPSVPQASSESLCLPSQTGGGQHEPPVRPIEDQGLQGHRPGKGLQGSPSWAKL